MIQERSLGIVDDPDAAEKHRGGEGERPEMSESVNETVEARRRPPRRCDAPPQCAGGKVREGYVVSDKMDKTVVVAVEDRVKHRLYGKVLRQTSRLKAHDEANSAGVGDRVRIMETRPLCATKRWRLIEILEKAK